MDKNLINKIKNEKINYIVEWWEEDSLDIDSNQHILFSLENEDIDIEEATIQMKGAQLTYTASLMAAGKILQTNLLAYL